MKTAFLCLIGLLSIHYSNGQSDSVLVLQKVGLSRTVTIEIDDLIKVKTADGEYHKGRFVKLDGDQLITTYDTLNTADVLKIMANTKIRRRQSSLLMASGLIAVGIGSGFSYVASSASNEMEEGTNWGAVMLMMGSYFYAAHALFFGVINYNGYNSYQLAGKRAKWEIVN
ncbi:MAG: hypothetical protein ACPGLV_10850 [Bacteroidia bacterium]